MIMILRKTKLKCMIHRIPSVMREFVRWSTNTRIRNVSIWVRTSEA